MEIPDSKMTMTNEMRAELVTLRDMDRRAKAHGARVAQVLPGNGTVKLPTRHFAGTQSLHFQVIRGKYKEQVDGRFLRRALAVLAVLEARAIELAQHGLDLGAYRLESPRFSMHLSVVFDTSVSPEAKKLIKLSARIFDAVEELSERVELESLRSTVDLNWLAKRQAHKAATEALVERMALVIDAFEHMDALKTAELDVDEYLATRADAEADVAKAEEAVTATA